MSGTLLTTFRVSVCVCVCVCVGCIRPSVHSTTNKVGSDFGRRLHQNTLDTFIHSSVRIREDWVRDKMHVYGPGHRYSFSHKVTHGWLAGIRENSQRRWGWRRRGSTWWLWYSLPPWCWICRNRKPEARVSEVHIQTGWEGPVHRPWPTREMSTWWEVRLAETTILYVCQCIRAVQ